MANSRTKILIPMLVLCFFAVTAYGQAVLSLGSNPTRVRVEGITEVVGLITLTNATNQNQIIPSGTTLSITFDGNITNDPGVATTAIGTVPNRNIYTTGAGSSQQDGAGGIGQYVLGGGCAGAAPAAGCVGLFVSRSGPTLTISVPATFNNTAAACGTAGAGGPFCLVPGGSLNIQGVRVNVSGLSGNIFATVVPTPANALTFPSGNNATIIGRAQATIGSVSVVGAVTQPQCTFPVTPTLNAGGAITAGGVGTIFNVNISEPSNFPTSFNASNSITPNLANPPNPAQSWDEAGITPGGIGGATTAGTTAVQLGFQGTAQPVLKGVQLVLNFAGLPAGVSLTALQQITGTGGNTLTGGLAISGPYTMGLVTSTGIATGVGATYVLYTGSGGAATVAYEVEVTGNLSPTTTDIVSIPFGVTAPAGTVIPVGPLGTVQASVGPVSTSTTFSSSATSGLTLRFAANSGVPATPISIGVVNACITNLLYPFVSNRTGTTFNTGIAISNTANDASFGAKGATAGQTGGVTLYFFGVSAPTGGTAGIALPIPAVSTGGTVATAGVIAPGEHTAFVLNDGSTKAIAPGFQGYVVASCQFLFAHGLGTIFDNFGVGPANVGFSYLSLVYNGSTAARGIAGNNVAGAFEALGH